MKKNILSLALLLTVAGTAHAHTIEVGKALPNINITDGGLASITGEDVSFSEWSISDISNTGTAVIIASAARPKASDLTPVDLVESLESNKDIKLYKIVNSDDAPFGAGMFIKGAIKKGKIAKPSVESVLDEDGEVFSEWELQEESSTIVVLKDGKVAYVHEGLVTDNEKSKVMSLMN